MKLNLNSETAWFNTMPVLGEEGCTFANMQLTLEPNEILAEGKYELEVRLKGFDGKEHIATAYLIVAHAC